MTEEILREVVGFLEQAPANRPFKAPPRRRSTRIRYEHGG